MNPCHLQRRALRLLHIRGHERDGSTFGRWNHIADRLCALRRPVDRTAPLSAFEEPGAPPRLLAKILAAM